MKKSFLALLFVTGTSNVLLCQKEIHSDQTSVRIKKPTQKKFFRYGIASYYAQKFNGRKTANDEIFSSTKYTAACNCLPFNTWIKVINLKNKKWVIVRINDRLYVKNKRLVDLSKIAAQELGYFGCGLAKVKIEVLKKYRI